MKLSEYENFIYSIPETFPSIKSSDLVLQYRGKTTCWLLGNVYFSKNIILRVTEVLDFMQKDFIENYGYTIFRQNEKLYYYDSQPHPHLEHLQITHPHHKHITPNIKHNRIPAPGLSFSQSNLPLLIREIEETLLKSS